MNFRPCAHPDIQPGTSAASNQRASFLKPPRVAVGRSHSADVNLPAAKLIRVSIRMSLTRVPSKTAPGVSHNPPHGAEHCRSKGLGPVSVRAVLTDTSVEHRWLYCTCQSVVWNRAVGKSVRCLDHFLMLVANDLRSWIIAYR